MSSGVETILKRYTARIKTATFPTTAIFYENPLKINVYPSIYFQIETINTSERTRGVAPHSYDITVVVAEKTADVSIDQLTGQQIMTAKTTCENKLWAALSDIALPYALKDKMTFSETVSNNILVAILIATITIFE